MSIPVRTLITPRRIRLKPMPDRLRGQRWALQAAAVLALALTACSTQSTRTPTVFPPTRTAAATATLGPVFTETPDPAQAIFTLTPTRPPVVTLAPTLGGPCANDAEFVADVTVPDGAQYLPGQIFAKRWRMLNSGTCDWGPDYAIVLTNGEPMGTATEASIYPARAGTEGVWEVELRAPDVPGSYTGRWQARAPDGNTFGQTVFVTIQVIPLPVTDTPTP